MPTKPDTRENGGYHNIAKPVFTFLAETEHGSIPRANNAGFDRLANPGRDPKAA